MGLQPHPHLRRTYSGSIITSAPPNSGDTNSPAGNWQAGRDGQIGENEGTIPELRQEASCQNHSIEISLALTCRLQVERGGGSPCVGRKSVVLEHTPVVTLYELIPELALTSGQ